jgi:hypothetical protein
MSTDISKVLQTWLIVSPTSGKRLVHQRPTRWDANTGVPPEEHEVQWDETVYLMKAEIVSPEEIDGPMVKVNDEALEEWEQPVPMPMTPTRWMAQEIFRRIQRIVPRNVYGPGAPMKSSCIGSTVNLEIDGFGAFSIKVAKED